MARRISSRETLIKHAIKALPVGIPAEAVDDVEIDYETTIIGHMEFNGYWIYLAPGYICTEMECHTIHEDTLDALRYMLSTVKRWPDDPALERERRKA